MTHIIIYIMHGKLACLIILYLISCFISLFILKNKMNPVNPIIQPKNWNNINNE